MKVSIDAAGRKVELEAGDANMTPAALADEALRVWRDTAGEPDASAPGFGLSQERRPDRPVGLGGPGRRATTPIEGSL